MTKETSGCCLACQHEKTRGFSPKDATHTCLPIVPVGEKFSVETLDKSFSTESSYGKETPVGWEGEFDNLWDLEFSTGGARRYFYQHLEIKKFISEKKAEWEREERTRIIALAKKLAVAVDIEDLITALKEESPEERCVQCRYGCRFTNSGSCVCPCHQ